MRHTRSLRKLTWSHPHLLPHSAFPSNSLLPSRLPLTNVIILLLLLSLSRQFPFSHFFVLLLHFPFYLLLITLYHFSSLFHLLLLFPLAILPYTPPIHLILLYMETFMSTFPHFANHLKYFLHYTHFGNHLRLFVCSL